MKATNGMPSGLSAALRVLIPFALAYFLSYLFRVVNAIIAPNLAADLDIGPADLGLLTSAYFVSFAAFQLPLGVMLDRIGPRRVEAGLLVFAAAGALIFGMAVSLPGLFVGRALIGLGVSAGYMAAIKAYTLWFPPQQWPRVNGLHLAAGGFGALSATLPVEFALTYTDWRGVFIALSILSAIVAALIFACVPEKRQEAGPIRLSDAVRGIGQVFTSPLFWRVTPLAVASQVAFMSIHGLWAGPWLRDVAGMDRAGIAGVLFWTAAAMTAGYAAIGFITERLSRSGIKPMTTAVWGMFLFMGIQALIMLGPVHWAPALWMLFGFTGTTGVIPYPALAMSFPSQLAGRVSTGLNVLVFIAAFAAQWGIGAVIALFPVTAAG
ncbi:MAG: MFS transporter, partial [Deltaproteobacteria bacterium]|nr:MFS transporter [Deltaproteobacteria bacterium]